MAGGHHGHENRPIHALSTVNGPERRMVKVWAIILVSSGLMMAQAPSPAPSAPATAQPGFRNLVAGVSNRTQVEAALGLPTTDLPSLAEYAPQQGTGKINVDYRPDGVVDRLVINFVQPIVRAAVVNKVAPGAQAVQVEHSNDGRLIEYFGAPAYVVLKFAGPEPTDGVESLGLWSRDLFAKSVPMAADAATTPTMAKPPSLRGNQPGASTAPATQPVALPENDAEFHVKLLTPISTETNRKGDKIAAQVVSPPQFQGDILEGQIRESKSGGKVTGKSSLNFTFEQLLHANQAIAIRTSVKSVANSKGKQDVDEEGRLVHKQNNLPKAAAVAGLGALVGGVVAGGQGAAIGAGAGAAVGLILIKMTSQGANIAFAPGSEFVLLVRRER